MPKKDVKWIYQDCPMCGSRKEWGENQLKIAKIHGIRIIKIPFYSEGSEGLMWKAVESGIKSYPFFTDGIKFSKNIEDFIETPKKSAKKTKKVKEPAKNGNA